MNFSFWPFLWFGLPGRLLIGEGRSRFIENKGGEGLIQGHAEKWSQNLINKGALVSHYSAIGDTISCDAPYSAIGFRGKLFLQYPPC